MIISLTHIDNLAEILNEHNMYDQVLRLHENELVFEHIYDESDFSWGYWEECKVIAKEMQKYFTDYYSRVSHLTNLYTKYIVTVPEPIEDKELETVWLRISIKKEVLCEQE
jgi:hypothetical protein